MPSTLSPSYLEALFSSRLILVDVDIDYEKKLVKAGWIWADTGLFGQKKVELKSEAGMKLKILIPRAIQLLPFQKQIYFADDTVDFPLCDK